MATVAMEMGLGWLGALPGRPWRVDHSSGPGMWPLGSWMLWELHNHGDKGTVHTEISLSLCKWSL